MRQERGRRGGGGLHEVGHQLRPRERRGAASSSSWPASPSPSASARSSARSSSASLRRRPRRSARWTFWRRAPSTPTSSNPALGRCRRHQEPPQCGRPARLCGLQGDHRAAAPALQGRGPSAGPRAGAARISGHAPALPRSRALPSASSARSTKDKLDTLRDADAIYREEIAKAGLDKQHEPVFRRPDQHALRGRHGRRPHLRLHAGAARRAPPGLHDRRLGPHPLRACWTGSAAASSTRSRASTASSTTSPANPPQRWSGNNFRGRKKPVNTGFFES